MPGTTAPRGPRAGARATGRSRWCSRRPIRTRCTTRTSSCSRRPTARRRWTQISADLTRPDPGVPPTLDAAAAADTDRNGKRGVIYTIAPSPLLVPMVWVGTDDGCIHVTTERRQDVAERDAAGADGVEPRDDDRGVALRRQRGVRERRPPPAAGLRAVHLSHARPGQDVAEDHRRAAGRRVRARREGRPDARRACCSPAPSAARSSRSTTATTGSRCSSTCRSTSVRDFEIYGNDLIVATHGRGFWVIDDISPLRQINDAVLRGRRVPVQAGRRDQRDPGRRQRHAAAEGRAAGAEPAERRGDRLLPQGRRASGPVTLEILDASGREPCSTFSSAAGGQPAGAARRRRGGGGIPNTSRRSGGRRRSRSRRARGHAPGGVAPGRADAAGRRGRRRRRRSAAAAAPLLTGTFTAKLTVNGQSYTQTFTVRPDPRQAEGR